MPLNAVLRRPEGCACGCGRNISSSPAIRITKPSRRRRSSGRSVSSLASRAKPTPTAGTIPSTAQRTLRHSMARGCRASTQPPLTNEIILMTAAVKDIGARCNRVTLPSTISPSAKPLNAWTKLPRPASKTKVIRSGSGMIHESDSMGRKVYGARGQKYSMLAGFPG